MKRYEVYLGSCLDVIKTLPDQSVDACICDPPYPCIARRYGIFTEAHWHSLMNELMPEVRRVLKPKGSAVFVLQPNSEKIGKMRLWLWEFVAKWGREWNFIQDAYWFNSCALPVGVSNNGGLLRPSVKPCCWFGASDCYRDQRAVLMRESENNKRKRIGASSVITVAPSGRKMNEAVCRSAALRRGGTTPFNLLSIGGGATRKRTRIHPARTPYRLAEWWIRYLCPLDGVVFDPFMGVATIGEAALNLGRRYIGIERMPEYFDVAVAELAEKTARQINIFEEAA